MKSALASYVACLAFLAACSEEAREALVDPPVVDGKTDAADRVSLRGTLGIGPDAAVSGSFAADREWHGYVLSLRPDAVVTIDVTRAGSSGSLDTTLYLYGPRRADGGYGDSASAFDDDAGWGRLSRLTKKKLAGGDWLVVVGTRDGRGRGSYRLEAKCEGGEGTCAPVVAVACNPAIAAGIDACVAAWLDDPDFDPSTSAREDLIAQCADAEPMAPVRDRLCAGAGAPADVCALSMEAFHTDYLPVCRRAAIGAWLDQACVFGERYGDLFGRAEAIVVLGERKLTDPAALTALEEEQIVAAVKATAYDDADTIEKAFESVDDNEVNQVELWDASNRKGYTAYEVGAGDNSFGMVFAYGTTTEVVRNNDGDWYDCTVTWGPERRRCEADAHCGAGAKCVGASESSPLGRCIDGRKDTSEAEGTGCAIEDGVSTCPAGAGLVCAGASRGDGMCLPAWMRGHFASEPALPIPDGAAAGVSAQVLVFGLATVDMDVAIELEISHSRPKDLLVTLTNPAGAEVVVHDGASTGGDVWFDLKPLVGFSGDESVNGVWRLKVVDRTTGQKGTLERFGLQITSRWD